MRLVSLTDPVGALAVVTDRGVVTARRLGDDLPPTMAALLAGGPGALDALRSAVAVTELDGPPLDDVVVLAPVPECRQVIAVGRNYREHTSEQGATPPAEPLLFAKLPSSICAPGDDIVWDPTIATQVDYEAELGVVIGRTTRRVAVEDALASVFGYCCVDDVTARDLQRNDGQWFRGKSSDTFCPFGPVLVTADEVPDPQRLDIRCTVNGEVRQSSNTSEMFFSVAEIISYCSQVVTLRPGDLITTGTPGGVGMHMTPPRLLADGDEVVVEVEGLGRLVNRCRTLV
ncbi:MAG: fumarylacetoacetate hydrolase family protein [Acidimicrobiales bacterium]